MTDHNDREIRVISLNWCSICRKTECTLAYIVKLTYFSKISNNTCPAKFSKILNTSFNFLESNYQYFFNIEQLANKSPTIISVSLEIGSEILFKMWPDLFSQTNFNLSKKSWKHAQN